MNTTKISVILSAIFFTSLLFSNSLYAKPPKGEHRKPPQEAIDACVDKAEGDEVTFTTRRGDEITGICTTMKEIFVAVPENMEPPQEREDRESRDDRR